LTIEMSVRARRAASALAAVAVLGVLPGCSIKRMAINSLGNALAEGSSGFAKDDDPELVWDAVPFGLKTVETLLDESPRHRGLLLAAASGFTQYAYGSLQQDADFVEADDLSRATALRTRARKLYQRAMGYGFRGLDLDVPGFKDALRRDAKATLAKTGKPQLRLLYWTAAAWAAAIGLAVNDSELSADQDLAEAMMRRALALDESWEWGSIHDFFISWEAAHASVSGSYERARQHYDKALALSKGLRAWPMVNFAESVAVPKQDRQGFKQELERALAVPPGGIKDQTLTNLLAQKRARWLLGRLDELFIE
jgi:predicted anti-sigma-YlaC factor YlaD